MNQLKNSNFEATKVVQRNIENYWRGTSKTFFSSIFETEDIFYVDSVIEEVAEFNAIYRIGSDFSDKSIETVIHESQAQYLSKPHGWFVNSLISPPCLSNVLKNFGYKPLSKYMGMSMRLDRIDDNVKLPDDVYIKQVVTHEDFENWILPLQEAFHWNDIVASSYQRMLEEFSGEVCKLQHYVAVRADRPISACSVFYETQAKTVGLYNGGTVNDARRQGIMGAMLRQGLVSARNNGYEDAVVFASPFSQGLCKRIGFEACSEYEFYGI